ncbi:MAG: phosphonate metabolism protein/1,5-bisphosphokinase (PRPP-forming) PhnN [Marinobacter sp.]|nr:phosphonate metabolism protein/1,5-bisphosphokinase (PRPP-forming) PhnN [Marinobacter sp.]
MPRASLIYLVGPSGSGKDSLMAYARHELATEPGLVFCHRYITRKPDAGGENHIYLSADEFAARQQAGLFAMHWQSHGQRYGVGIEINQWLAKGVSVVVNGSRSYLPEIANRYPELKVVWIEVSEATLRARLVARGRESLAAIEARMARNKELLTKDRTLLQQRLITLDNNGPLSEAGNRLVQLLETHRGTRQCA